MGSGRDRYGHVERSGAGQSRESRVGVAKGPKRCQGFVMRKGYIDWASSRMARVRALARSFGRRRRSYFPLLEPSESPIVCNLLVTQAERCKLRSGERAVVAPIEQQLRQLLGVETINGSTVLAHMRAKIQRIDVLSARLNGASMVFDIS